MNLKDSAETITKYFKEGGYTFRPLRQKGDEVSLAYGVRGYPTNYLIDAEGRVAGRWIGFEEGALRAALSKLAGK
jgi:hypothetical protein